MVAVVMISDHPLWSRIRTTTDARLLCLKHRYTSGNDELRVLLRQACDASGLSYRALSKKLKRNPNYVHLILTGGRSLQIDEFFELASVIRADGIAMLKRVYGKN